MDVYTVLQQLGRYISTVKQYLPDGLTLVIDIDGFHVFYAGTIGK